MYVHDLLKENKPVENRKVNMCMPFFVTCYVTGAEYSQKRFSIDFGGSGVYSIYAENGELIIIIKDGIPYNTIDENYLEPMLHDGLNTLWAVLTKIGIVASIPFISFFQGIDITNKIFKVSFEQDAETVSVGTFLKQLRSLDIPTTTYNLNSDFDVLETTILEL